MKQEYPQKDPEQSYFDTLSLRKGDVSSFVRGYMSNIRIVLLILLTVIIGGISAFATLPRNLNPPIEIPIVFVSTVLPGAGPETVESLVTKKIEDEVRGLENIDTVTSTSVEGQSTVVAQFVSGINRKDAERDVQSAIQSVSDLPEDATTPRVSSLDFENDPIWTFVLTGESDPASLMRFAENLKEKLEDLPRIDTVTLQGSPNTEVSIFIRPETANQLGLSLESLAQTITLALGDQPGGIAYSPQGNFGVGIDAVVFDLETLRSLPLPINGSSITLGSIATIEERGAPGSNDTFVILNGDETIHQAVTFEIRRVSSERFDVAYQDAETLVAKELETSRNRYAIHTINSLADEVNTQFTELFGNFMATVTLVFVILLLFFGLRQAVIASLAIPLAFLIALLVMQVTGMSINFLSLFSLLLSLGLLVDVTIVVISAVSQYARTNKFTPLETVLLVWRDYKITLLATTFTTVWAFTPLLLASGIIGEFIKPIPIVVSSAVLGSLFVGLFIALPLLGYLLKPSIPRRVAILFRTILALALFVLTWTVTRDTPVFLPGMIIALLFGLLLIFQGSHILHAGQKKFTQHKTTRLGNNIRRVIHDGLFSLGDFSAVYKVKINRILRSKIARRKTVFAVVIFFLFAIALLPAGLVKNEFFPKADQDFFYIGIELPAGTNSTVTREEAIALAPRIIDTLSVYDFLQIQTGLTITPEGGISASSGDNTILYTISLPPEKNRSESSIDIAQSVRESLATYDQGEVSVVELSGGPPAGADVVIQFYGDDLDTLENLAGETQDFLKNNPGITTTDISSESGSAKIVFIPDTSLLATQNSGIANTGNALRIFTNGLDVKDDQSFSDLADTRDVVLRYTNEIQNLGHLGSFSAQGYSLLNDGTFVLRPNPTVIDRKDGKRVLSVSAGVAQGYPVTDMNAQAQEFVESLDLPEGYSWTTGGANEENNDSVASILQAMLLAFVLILITLVIQLRSYRKSLIVLLVIPLALSGVFIVFALTGTPLSFPALIGVLALFGIVVNNSIILVDKINLNLRSGMRTRSAVADASASRLEPIVLGSLTTIVGLIPITLSDPLWQGLGGAIISGLLFSGTIMLFFIPVVYVMWFGDDEPKETIHQK